MANESEPSAQLPADVWLQLLTKQLDKVEKSLDGERKNRSKREFALLITCLLALLYANPVHGSDGNSIIEIPAISLKIPLSDAIIVFPTILAAVYLVFLASAIGESMLLIQRLDYIELLDRFQETGRVPVAPKRPWAEEQFRFWRYFLLPSPLHRRGFVIGAAAMPRAVVDIFVGFVFTLVPYVTQSLVLIRSWQLVKVPWILLWNLMCLVTMLLALIGALMPNAARQWRYSK